jgi:hypothetical protein
MTESTGDSTALLTELGFLKSHAAKYAGYAAKFSNGLTERARNVTHSTTEHAMRPRYVSLCHF